MKKIVIFGNGEFAEISQYYFGKENIAHFCVDDENVKESHFKGSPLLSYSELLKLDKSEFDIFIAVSQYVCSNRKNTICIFIIFFIKNINVFSF